jgi:ribosomal-protein-alanine N-acetyltransferase
MTSQQLAAIHAECFTVPRPWSAEEFADMLGAENIFLCAQPDGFALGRVAGPEAELLTLAVRPAEQGKGTGRQLLRQYEAEARKRGATEAFLEVAVDNDIAIHLYRSEGYTDAGWRKDYYEGPTGTKISCLVLRKELASE